ncbi:MAG: hypothetical protein ACI8PZ_000436 [Myxococcota bacterium]|jgi:hypothetical protein
MVHAVRSRTGCRDVPVILVTVRGVPDWVPAARLLGRGEWELGPEGWTARLDRDTAADVVARLRNVGLGGQLLDVTTRPRLKRTAVRAGRTRDARARRTTTPGFIARDTRLDDEGRWSLTPEALAVELAAPWAGCRVVDATCGAGGNAIAFARAGCTVVAIDTDAARLALAQHNAGVYRVQDRIQFVLGDAFDLVPRHPADLLFVDPPWGTEWNRTRTAPEDLPPLPALLAMSAPALIAKVPPSFDPRTVPGAVPQAWFGRADGDRHRIKFVTVSVGTPPDRASATPR